MSGNCSLGIIQRFCCLNTWRDDDIARIKDTIDIYKHVYGSMLDSPVESEADQQWHDGVTQSIHIMEQHIDKLDNYSRTPPRR